MYNRVYMLSVIVSFPLLETPDVSMIAWTTTPWTLPSNVALCVHPDLDYVKIKGAQRIHACMRTLSQQPFFMVGLAV